MRAIFSTHAVEDDPRKIRSTGESLCRPQAGHVYDAASWRRYACMLGFAALVLPVLFWTSRENYLLFHGIVELLGVAVAWGVFLLVWNARRFIAHDAFAFLGLALFSTGWLDLLHTLAYKGMGVLAAVHDANPATQLWIAARILAISGFLAFPLLIGRRLRLPLLAAGYGCATILAAVSILAWKVFPDCFVEGRGLTPFKRVAEYLICMALAVGLAFLWRRRDRFEPGVFRGLAGVFLVTIASELCFTLYSDVYGVLNFTGHILKLLSVYLLYRSLIQASLTLPYVTLFRELDQDHRDLKKVEFELRQSEARFRNMFDLHAAVKLLIDPVTGAIVDANEAAVKYYGWSRDEICRMRIREINTLSPDEVAGEMQKAKEARRNYFEFRHRLADGSIHDVAVFSSDVAGMGKPLLHSIIHDITEQKKAETALRESEERFRSLVEQAPDGIFIQTRRRFAYVNAAMVRLLGATGPEQFVGELVESRIHPDFLAVARERIRELNEQRLPQSPMDLMFVRLDGSPCDVNITGTPFAFKGEQGALVFVRDISERKLVEHTQQFVAQCGLPLGGEDFFVSLARYLAMALPVDYVSIGRLLGASMVESLATWDRGALATNGCRELEGSPCGLAIGTGVYHCPAGARQAFPRHGPIEELGVESLYAVRLSDTRGEPIGFICLAGRSPMPDPVPAKLVLGVAAPRAAAELERRRQESVAAENHKRLISIIDAMPDPVYVSDPETYELLFVNNALRSILGEVSGRPCHEYLQGRDSPCPFCTNDKLFGANFGQPVEWEFQNLKNGRWYRLVDRGITWPDGRRVRFEMAMDLTGVKQAELALRETLIEKTALLKEVHHRVKNNLQVVASLLGMQARRLDNAAARNVLQDSQSRVLSMALLHELLYRTGSLAHVDFDSYTERLCAALLRTVGPVAQRVRIERSVGDIRLPLEQAVPCGLMINEMVTNALKHGYPDDCHGRVCIEMKVEDHMIRLRVSDDGAGLPDGLDINALPTLGLRLVQDLARQLQGAYRMERREGAEGGTAVSVVFPVKGWQDAGGST